MTPFDLAGSGFAGDDPDALRAPRRLAVLGSPIAHTRSPLLHSTAYAALGLPWEYGVADVTAEALASFVEGLDASWRGLSLTMPLKETVFELLDSVDAIGSTSGAVNTVLVTRAEGRRRLDGFNTDVLGIAEALTRAGVPSVSHALVVGGGATARSAVLAVARLGAEHVDIVLRSPAKGEAAAETARRAGLSSSVLALHDPAVAGLAPDVTISSLPGGVDAAKNFAGSAAVASSTLLDVAYSPWPSQFATLWSEAGSAVIPGLAMLVHQAVAQVRVFVNGDPLLALPGEEQITAALLEVAGLDAAGGFTA
ncbi:shikimate dehydrogenase [Herbiconiux sp. 11R-BC]|uniref:shikimate dehydrogenase family protein n=1 Tax=Herbiconiux sp. 11R-BC TaxID=3111637 RepID=UPI003C0EC701